MVTDRDERVYGALMELTAELTETMADIIKDQAAGHAPGETIDIRPHVSAAAKAAFHMGLEVGLSAIGADVLAAINAFAEQAGGMPPMPDLIESFREALGESPGRVH